MKIRARTLLTAAVAVAALAGLTAAQPAAAAVAANAAAPTFTRTPCPGGVLAIPTKPAKGFNPLTATPAQLEANNYPAAPSRPGTAAYAKWKRFVLSPSVLTSTCPNTKPNDLSNGPVKTAATPDGVTGKATLVNWSGYMAHGVTYTQAEAQWHVPGIISAVSGTNEYSSSWVGVGLGQNASHELMQAGTETNYTSGAQQNYLWYELYPHIDEVQLINVSPGDVVGAHISYESAGPIFHIWDSSKNYNKTFQYSFSGSDDGHAEWIYERTSINKKFPYLADAPPTFADAQAVTGGSWKSLSAASDVEDLMYNCAGTTEMAYPEGIQGANTFTAHFLNHGDNNAC